MIIIPDANNSYDHVVYNILKDVDSGGLPIVPITRTKDFKFNERLLDIKGKWILGDFIEYGWNWDRTITHFFGFNTHTHYEHLFQGEEWKKFNDFISNNPPVICFKRELKLTNGCSYPVYPIDWPCFHDIPKIESREDFNKRAADVFFAWGHSNEARRLLHGKIFTHASDQGYGVLDNIYYLERGLQEYKKVWITLQIPHYARVPMPQLLFIQGHAKISISLPGAGVKCFRHAESPINSVMYLHEDGMAYSYPWEHRKNCIRSVPGKEIEAIEKALERDDLYDLYVAGVENLKNYQLQTYQRNYIEPIIKQHT